MIYSYEMLGNWGRLGNCLFQLASTISIAFKNNATASFPEWNYQPYFSIPKHFFDNIKGEVDFSGDYLQDYHHFESYKDIIRRYFAAPQSVTDYLRNKYDYIYNPRQLTQHIAVHVRRGDYLNLPLHHPVCGLEYFEQGIEIVSKVCPGWHHQLVVFSDDIEWCKQQELFKDAIFAEHNNPAEDLHLMKRCNAFVISNSTLSWWGAYLSETQNVIVPTPWYGEALQHIDVKNTLILPNWTELNR